MVYYAQAINLIFEGVPLCDEKIEAWMHGPAIPEVYRKYKIYSYFEITEKVNMDQLMPIFSENQIENLEITWKEYAKFDGEYLEMLTHEEEPWQIARAGIELNSSCNNEIKLEWVKEFYKNKQKRLKNPKKSQN